MFQVFHNTNFQMMGRTKYFFMAFSMLALTVAFGSMAIRGFNFGIDFAGGTAVQIRFREAPRVEDLRARLEAANLGDINIQQIGSVEDNEVLVRVEQQRVKADDEACGDVAEHEAAPTVHVENTMHAAPNRTGDVTEHLPQPGSDGEESCKPREQDRFLVRSEVAPLDGVHDQPSFGNDRLELVDRKCKRLHGAARAREELGCECGLVTRPTGSNICLSGHTSILPPG